MAKFVITEKEIISKAESLYDWHLSSGKKKKDWIATLRNAIRKDFKQRLDRDEYMKNYFEELRKEYPHVQWID